MDDIYSDRVYCKRIKLITARTRTYIFFDIPGNREISGYVFFS